jgi:hypothetical protein
MESKASANLQRELDFAVWRKTAAQTAIKAKYLEMKLKRLLTDSRLTNNEIAAMFREAVQIPKVALYLRQKTSAHDPTL